MFCFEFFAFLLGSVCTTESWFLDMDTDMVLPVMNDLFLALHIALYVAEPPTGLVIDEFLSFILTSLAKVVSCIIFVARHPCSTLV